jgi:hypothetical protein
MITGKKFHIPLSCKNISIPLPTLKKNDDDKENISTFTKEKEK